MASGQPETSTHVSTDVNSDSAGDELIFGVKESRLPIPCGYKLLVKPLKPNETTDGGILKASQTLQREEVGACVGYVIQLGPDAYKDEKRFPSGPRCEAGSYVVFQPYVGARFRVDGEEFRLINDDSVDGVVEDPRGVERI